MPKIKKPPYFKGRKTCIYCGGVGMSGEHIWADWLRKYIPRDLTKYRTISTVVFPDRSLNQVKSRTIPGDPHTQRIRAVCMKCNNEWMSQLQRRAKPYLVPMLEGKNTIFYKNGQTALAAWVAMFVMTADYLDKTMGSISFEERNQFRKVQRPGRHWKIWIGKYNRYHTKARWFHNVLPITKDKTQIVPGGGIPAANSQSSTILLGQHLIIQAMSSPIVPRIIRRWNMIPIAASAMTQIWPVQERIVRWPGSTLLDEAFIEPMAHEFFRRCDLLARHAEGFE